MPIKLATSDERLCLIDGRGDPMHVRCRWLSRWDRVGGELRFYMAWTDQSWIDVDK